MRRVTDKTGWYRRQEERYTALLPADIRAKWCCERASRILRPSPADDYPRKRAARRKKLPVGMWSYATGYLRLRNTLLFIQMGGGLATPCTDLAVLVTNEWTEKLLAAPLARLGGPTVSIMLRDVYTIADRILRVHAPGLLAAAKRLERRKPRRDLGERRRSHAIYRDAAVALAPDMLPGETHTIETALLTRHAASCGIAVEAATRRAEVAGLDVRDIVIDGGKATVVIPASLRKAGDPASRELSSEISRIVIDYVLNARPVLAGAAVKGSVPTDALWLTRTGTALKQEGLVAASFVSAMKGVLGVTAGCNLFRQAMASRKDVVESEASLLLNQSSKSSLADDLYAEYDRPSAVADLQALWEGLMTD